MEKPTENFEQTPANKEPQDALDDFKQKFKKEGPIYGRHGKLQGSWTENKVGVAEQLEKIAENLNDESKKREALNWAAKNYYDDAISTYNRAPDMYRHALSNLKKSADLYKLLGDEENLGKVKEEIKEITKWTRFHIKKKKDEIDATLKELDDFE